MLYFYLIAIWIVYACSCCHLDNKRTRTSISARVVAHKLVEQVEIFFSVFFLLSSYLTPLGRPIWFTLCFARNASPLFNIGISFFLSQISFLVFDFLDWKREPTGTVAIVAHERMWRQWTDKLVGFPTVSNNWSPSFNPRYFFSSISFDLSLHPLFISYFHSCELKYCLFLKWTWSFVDLLIECILFQFMEFQMYLHSGRVARKMSFNWIVFDIHC